MAKETVSAKIRSEIRDALIKEAKKEKRTLSWFIESIIEDYAKRKKIAA